MYSGIKTNIMLNTNTNTNTNTNNTSALIEKNLFAIGVFKHDC